MSKAPEGMRWSPLNGKYVPDIKVESKAKEYVAPTCRKGYDYYDSKEATVKAKTNTTVTKGLSFGQLMFYSALVGVFIAFKVVSYTPSRDTTSSYTPSSVSSVSYTEDDVLKAAALLGFSIGVGRNCGMSDSEMRTLSDKGADKINTMTNDGGVRYKALQEFKNSVNVGLISSRNMSSTSSECSTFRSKLNAL